MSVISQFPLARLRRNRSSDWLRSLNQEKTISVKDVIWPIFVRDESVSASVETMPGVSRYMVSELSKVVEEAQNLGIPAIALFPCVDERSKSLGGEAAWDEDNLISKAIKEINKHRDREKLGLIVDVALDPYTTHGHDGILDDRGDVDNDETLIALSKQALCLADAGVDMVSPSDMMDGRIEFIRTSLDDEGYTNVGIMAYAVKYNSAFYGPFRSAVGSDKCLKKANKLTYQLMPSNAKEAMREIAYDVNEGADSVIIKPGMPYLDIAAKAAESFTIPVFAYQVSGEYSMIKMAAKHAGMDEKAMVLESLYAFKRAGCTGVWTYFAPDIAKYLQNL